MKFWSSYFFTFGNLHSFLAEIFNIACTYTQLFVEQSGLGRKCLNILHYLVRCWLQLLIFKDTLNFNIPTSSWKIHYGAINLGRPPKSQIFRPLPLSGCVRIFKTTPLLRTSGFSASFDSTNKTNSNSLSIKMCSYLK